MNFEVSREDSSLTVEYRVTLVDAPHVTAGPHPHSKPTEIALTGLTVKYRNGTCEWVILHGPRVLSTGKLGQQMSMSIDRGRLLQAAKWLDPAFRELDARAEKAAGAVYELTVQRSRD